MKEPRKCDLCGEAWITVSEYRVAAYPGYVRRWYCDRCAVGHEHNRVTRRKK